MKRILVRTPNWIGDQMMTFPFFWKLREQFPQDWIAVVCTEWVADLQFRALVDEVITISKRPKGNWLKTIKWFKEVQNKLKQRGPWDLGILLPNSFGAALLFWISKIKCMRGYATDGRSFFLSEAIAWDSNPAIHRAQTYLKLALDGIASPFTFSEFANKFDAVEQWPAAKPLDRPLSNYFVIAPGAVADSRRWSIDQFVKLAEALHQKTGWNVVLVGGMQEQKLASQFEKNYPHQVLNYVGNGSVSSLWKVFRDAKITFANDSGLAHVAAMCGSKVKVIWGAGNPTRTHPIGPGNVELITNPVSCWPCERNVCALEGELYLQCLKGIEHEAVLNSAWKELFENDFR